MRVTSRVISSGGFQREIDRLKREVRGAVDAGMRGVVKEAKAGISRNQSDASGQLRKSLRYKVVQKRNLTEGILELPEYGIYLDQGTKPHRPPIDSLGGGGILQWVKNKGILPNPPARRTQNIAQAQRSVAFAIAESIAKRGTRPHPFLKRAVEVGGGIMDRKLRTGLR